MRRRFVAVDIFAADLDKAVAVDVVVCDDAEVISGTMGEEDVALTADWNDQDVVSDDVLDTATDVSDDDVRKLAKIVDILPLLGTVVAL